MFLLLELYGIAAPIRRVAAMLSPILPGTRADVESIGFEWYSDCCFCADRYLVEPDAFGDGCMTYYLQVAGCGESDAEGGE
jgi:hypothetical protein